jgi:hypothetical protein
MRAHMNPVKTYKIFHHDLKRIMTFPEQKKVQMTDFTVDQFKTGVNILTQQFKLHPDAFDIY